MSNRRATATPTPIPMMAPRGRPFRALDVPAICGELACSAWLTDGPRALLVLDSEGPDVPGCALGCALGWALGWALGCAVGCAPWVA